MNARLALGELRFPASYLETLIQTWKQEGLPVDRLLEVADLHQRYPLPADAFLTGADLLRLHQAASTTARPPRDFSLKLAQQFNFTNAGLLGFAVVSADNLRNVLDILQRYFHLFCPGVELRSVIEVDRFSICLQASPDFRAVMPFLNEVVAGVIKRFTLYFRSRLQPILVEFQHPAPANRQVFESYFGCPVRFGSAGNCIYFATADLDASPAMAEPATREQLERQLERALKQQAQEASWTERTQAAWLERVNAGHSATLEEIAAQFNLTARTLERRLQQEHTSFSQIVQAMRLRRARELLNDNQIAIAEVASRIGFRDSTSFSRFFKQATGTTPAAYRAQRDRR